MSVEVATPRTARDCTLQDKIDHLSRLGPDMLAEFLVHLDELAGCWPQINALLDAYHCVSAGMVRKAGGRRE